MPKIKLDPEELRVDTFSVSPEARGRDGTVLAHSATYTLPIPYSICTSATGESANNCYTAPDVGTCNHTVCDCDQDVTRGGDC